MRTLFTFALTLGLFTAVSQADDTKNKLEGTWEVVKASQGGKVNDDIQGDKLTFKDGMIVVASKKREEKATFTVDESQKPAHLDIKPVSENSTLQGIYEIKDDTLKLCVVEDPMSPRPTEFVSKEGSKSMLIELKRVKK